MRPSRSSQSCPQHSISKIQYCRTLGKNGGGSTAQYTCNPLIACVPTHPSGCSQESAAVAVSFQPMGHAVWYRVRAAEVPADSEVSSLSLLVKKGKSLVLKRTKVWKSTGPTSQADKQDSPHLHSVHSENVILILYFNSLKTNYLFGCAGS